MYNGRRKKAIYFDNISSVMDGLVKNLRLEKGLKISSFSKLWPKIIGPRFEKTSKIFAINETNGSDVVTVAVSSSSVAQDLIFYKKDILKKLLKVGANFGFNVKDVNFSTRYWKNEIKEFKPQEKILLDEDLEQIQIPEDVLNSIKISLNEETFFDEETKERFFKTIINDLKTQIWKKENNL